MSETANNESTSSDEEVPPSTGSAEELPPVEPPSARLIMQLFLLPALIVMAVIGVWLLFGKLASNEQDWHKLVSEVGSNNPHRRWRGALGLAQMLRADQERGPKGRQLVRNPLIAEELSKLFHEQLRERTQVTDDDLKQLEFLARTLGSLDVPQTTLPVLREAMLMAHDPEKYRDVRKNAIAAIAMTAGRGSEQGRPLDDPALVDDLVKVSKDSDRMLRELGAYTLGLVPGLAARQRLVVLLGDRHVNTRVNAAVGLARRKSTEGFPVFKTVLAEAVKPAPRVNTDHQSDSAQDENANSEEFQRLLILKNSLQAVDLLANEFTVRQRSELAKLLEPIAEGYPARTLRMQAGRVLKNLTGR